MDDLIIYKGYSIEFNQVPEAQWDYSVGFGWAFVVRSEEPSPQISQVILKSMLSERTPENKQLAFSIGLQFVKSLIDNSNLQERQCYIWEADKGELIEHDCYKPPFKQFLSPLI